jgi:hypothetical protein
VTCTGNACTVVTIVWDRQQRQYCVRNLSDRRVRLTFTTWPSTLAVVLEPREAQLVAILEFELPYRAEFIE